MKYPPNPRTVYGTVSARGVPLDRKPTCDRCSRAGVWVIAHPEALARYPGEVRHLCTQHARADYPAQVRAWEEFHETP